jgi:hypothetical protein
VPQTLRFFDLSVGLHQVREVLLHTASNLWRKDKLSNGTDCRIREPTLRWRRKAFGTKTDLTHCAVGRLQDFERFPNLGPRGDLQLTLKFQSTDAFNLDQRLLLNAVDCQQVICLWVRCQVCWHVDWNLCPAEGVLTICFVCRNDEGAVLDSGVLTKRV